MGSVPESPLAEKLCLAQRTAQYSFLQTYEVAAKIQIHPKGTESDREKKSELGGDSDLFSSSEGPCFWRSVEGEGARDLLSY